MSAPLAGIRIVEIGHMLAGPYCGLLLADMGAEVIKIEPPEGDIARKVSPHFIGPHNAYFASLNRNKKSVVIDLAGGEGRAQLEAIVGRSHALITNLRPSAIKKLGLTYDSLRRCNERVVCVALTGYGLEGPYSDSPAYDYVIQALTGVMALTGDPSAPPTKAGYSAVDNSAGLVAAMGLLAKIVEGKGGQVDVAMYDVMLSQLNYLAGAALNTGEVVERMANSSHPYVVPAQIFPTAQGWLTLFITHDKFWQKFCREAGRPDWVTDPVFATMASRRQNREQVLAAIGAVLLTAPAADWVRRLVPLGVVAAEVGTLDAALDSDLTRSRELVVPLGDGSQGLRAIGSPLRFNDFTPSYGLPPLLDEHREQVLGRMACEQ
jgi:crotonobetainyl-CoA:carnitine CoA-transferase CaiB-like acyl-CoA transferase